MQVGAFTPAVLLLLADGGSQLRAFNALESFLIRRMMTIRQTTKDYNSLALQLANRLRNTGLGGADSTVIQFLREPGCRFPSMA